MKSIWQYRGEPLSFSAKNNLSRPASKLPPELIEAAGSPIIAKLLFNRGVTTAQAVSAFLKLEDYQPTSGLELPDMAIALERIQQAIADQENILIYGDFDVDGMTGTSILMETLTWLGAQVTYYIPDRATEGHGLNVAASIRLASSRKLKLLITTDTGITNFSEISLLKNLGVDTIVTDHHELPENLPPSIANVNPKLLPDQKHPLAPLCGAGVAYKLCELLLEAVGTPEALRRIEALLDLTAIGTVADLASLHYENRYLVYQGVKVLNQRKRLGVQEILAQAASKPDATLTSETIGFTIAPRLNALGRLDNATEAVELLTTSDVEKARTIAAHLEYLNRKRRELCDQTFLQAEQYLNQLGGLGDKKALILASTDWNLGVIGIVASRLIEKYHVPTFLMVVDEVKQQVRCSARSIPGFHLHDELLPLAEMFEGFGGHAGAGGFTLPLNKLGLFKDRMYAICAEKITEEQMRPLIEVDDKLSWGQINPHLVSLVNQLAPFGMDNPAPKFVVENITVSAQRGLGEEERHLKLILTDKSLKDAQPIEALVWNYGAKSRLNPTSLYHFVVVPELNTFNNSTKVQLIVEDIQEAVSDQAKTELAASLQKPLENKPERIPATPLAASVLSASVSSGIVQPVSSVNWIDHRSRESLESFIAQLMMPLQDRRTVLIYHEGQAPNIPFLDNGLLAGRSEIKPVQELILWDLPPQDEIFHQLLAVANPEVIHLVGGKYQSVPVFQTEANILKLLLLFLKKQTSETRPVYEDTIEGVATRLSLSHAVVQQGLMLLETAQWIQSEMLSEQDTDPLPGVRINLLQQGRDPMQMAQSLPFYLFKQSLQAMGSFRNWLLTQPLDTIKASLGRISSAQASSQIQSDKETSSHDHNRAYSAVG